MATKAGREPSQAGSLKYSFLHGGMAMCQILELFKVAMFRLLERFRKGPLQVLNLHVNLRRSSLRLHLSLSKRSDFVSKGGSPPICILDSGGFPLRQQDTRLFYVMVVCAATRKGLEKSDSPHPRFQVCYIPPVLVEQVLQA